MKSDATDRHRPETVLVCIQAAVVKNHLLRLLGEIGGYCMVTAADSAEALKHALEHAPDLLVCSHELSVMDGLALAQSLRGKVRVPVLLTTHAWSPELVKAAVDAGVAAFLTNYPTQAELSLAMLQAKDRLIHEEVLGKRVQELEQQLSDRKLIEKAKGLLMERERISEDAAFRMMRNLAMTRRISISVLAHELLTKNCRQGSP